MTGCGSAPRLVTSRLPDSPTPSTDRRVVGRFGHEAADALAIDRFRTGIGDRGVGLVEPTAGAERGKRVGGVPKAPGGERAVVGRLRAGERLGDRQRRRFGRAPGEDRFTCRASVRSAAARASAIAAPSAIPFNDDMAARAGALPESASAGIANAIAAGSPPNDCSSARCWASAHWAARKNRAPASPTSSRLAAISPRSAPPNVTSAASTVAAASRAACIRSASAASCCTRRLSRVDLRKDSALGRRRRCGRRPVQAMVSVSTPTRARPRRSSSCRRFG